MIVRQTQELELERERGREQLRGRGMNTRRRMRDSSSSSVATTDVRPGSFQAFLARTREHLCALLFAVEHIADFFGDRDVLEFPDLDSPEGFFAPGGGDGRVDDERAWDGEPGPWLEAGGGSDGSDCVCCLSDWSE